MDQRNIDMNARLIGKLFVAIFISILFTMCPGCSAAREREKIPSSAETGKLTGAAGENENDARTGSGVYGGTGVAGDDLPEWIKKRIEDEKAGKIANPPASIFRCVYRNRIVYYRPPKCCEIPGILWDENGKFICSPDGGLTGRGDGKCPDFHAAKKDCATIWRDSRSLR